MEANKREMEEMNKSWEQRYKESKDRDAEQEAQRQAEEASRN